MARSSGSFAAIYGYPLSLMDTMDWPLVDAEQLHLSDVLDEEDPMPAWVGHSLTYRIAVGLRRSRNLLTVTGRPT